ncbi:transposase, partial [Synechococcus sp. F70.1]
MPPEYTTQECSRCGYLVKKTLSTRTHRCPRCGLVLCRDHNAALNILRRGLELLGMVWNGTSGHEGTAPEGGTLGKSGTAAMKGQPDMVSALVEPRTRIPGLRPAVANALQGGEYV